MFSAEMSGKIKRENTQHKVDRVSRMKFKYGKGSSSDDSQIGMFWLVVHIIMFFIMLIIQYNSNKTFSFCLF